MYLYITAFNVFRCCIVNLPCIWCCTVHCQATSFVCKKLRLLSRVTNDQAIAIPVCILVLHPHLLQVLIHFQDFSLDENNLSLACSVFRFQGEAYLQTSDMLTPTEACWQYAALSDADGTGTQIALMHRVLYDMHYMQTHCNYCTLSTLSLHAPHCDSPL